jgi:molecular chaperone GrpE
MSKIAKNKKKKTNSNKVLKLEEKNKILEAEIKELKSKNIALLAEFDNYKKRVLSQIANDKKYEGKDIFVNIIPIIDDIERVLIVDDIDSKSIISGIDLIKNKFLSVLEDLGVNSYKSVGKLFNPDYHEAIMMKKTKKKSNIIIEEYQKGYTQHDKVLRHAKVIVSE